MSADIELALVAIFVLRSLGRKLIHEWPDMPSHCCEKVPYWKRCNDALRKYWQETLLDDGINETTALVDERRYQ